MRFGYELAHSGNQVIRDFDERLGRVLPGCFILGEGLLFSLILVVGKDALHALLAPSWRELSLLVQNDYLLRQRRRYAFSGLLVRSYAVMTNVVHTRIGNIYHTELPAGQRLAKRAWLREPLILALLYDSLLESSQVS